LLLRECWRIRQVLLHQIVPLRSPMSGVLQPLHLPGVSALAPSLHSLEHHSPGLLELVKRVSPNTFPHFEQASSAQTLRSVSSFLTCSRDRSMGSPYCSWSYSFTGISSVDLFIGPLGWLEALTRSSTA